MAQRMGKAWLTHEENLHIFGRAALPRRPRIQGRAAALPYHDGKDFWPPPETGWFSKINLCKMQ
jgi:hypothetical protein